MQNLAEPLNRIFMNLKVWIIFSSIVLVCSCKKIFDSRKIAESPVATGSISSAQEFPKELSGRFYESCTTLSNNATAAKSYKKLYSFGSSTTGGTWSQSFGTIITYYDQVNCQSSTGVSPLTLNFFYYYFFADKFGPLPAQADTAFKINYYAFDVGISGHNAAPWANFIKNTRRQWVVHHNIESDHNWSESYDRKWSATDLPWGEIPALESEE